MHSSDQIGIGRFHGQVVMLAHHDMGVQTPAHLPSYLRQGFLERPDRSDIAEDILPVVPPVTAK